jgi:hypothetical protein
MAGGNKQRCYFCIKQKSLAGKINKQIFLESGYTQIIKLNSNDINSSKKIFLFCDEASTMDKSPSNM